MPGQHVPDDLVEHPCARRAPRPRGALPRRRRSPRPAARARTVAGPRRVAGSRRAREPARPGLAERRPGVQVHVGGAVQGRGEQDRTLDRRVAAVHERELGAERPADEPAARQVAELGELDRGRDVELLTVAPSNAPSLVPRGLDVPRGKRSTARPARAGSRQAALR